MKDVRKAVDDVRLISAHDPNLIRVTSASEMRQASKMRKD